MNIKIGLFGFGVVGQGFHQILSRQNGNAPGRIVKICVRNRNKPRTLPEHHFSYHASAILNDPEITHVVELTDRADDAYQIVRQALQLGKTVISANKKMLAERLPELIELQQSSRGVLLYEASACGSIPIFRNLDQYYAQGEVQGIQGIFNGSTNFILTQMTKERLNYSEALSQAQHLGFAETDPTLDVDAFDPASKLALLAAHGLGRLIPATDILRFGIRTATRADIDFAAQGGFRIRLIGTAFVRKNGLVCASVLPTFVAMDSPFYHLNDEYNGVQIQSAYIGNQFLTGKGAGSLPTGFAVLSDLTVSVQGGARGYERLSRAKKAALCQNREIRVYLRCPDERTAGLLPFTHILEKRQTSQGIQLTGKTTYGKIAATREALLDANAFLAQIPE